MTINRSSPLLKHVNLKLVETSELGSWRNHYNEEIVKFKQIMISIALNVMLSKRILVM